MTLKCKTFVHCNLFEFKMLNCCVTLLLILYTPRRECKGQRIFVSARNVNDPGNYSVSASISPNATVHELTTAILVGSPYGLTASVHLHGAPLSPRSALSDIGVGHGTELTFRLQHYRCNVRMRYSGLHGSFQADKYVYVPIGTGNFLQEIKRQVCQGFIYSIHFGFVRRICMPHRLK